MLKTVALVALLAAVATTSRAQDYCSLCADHTMCIYPEVGPNCKPLWESGTTADEAARIVEVHKEFRARLAAGLETAQPPAANMRRMKWEPELAAVAQRFASQCNYTDVSCNDVARFGVGQSVQLLAVTNWTAVGWGYVVGEWHDAGVALFDPGDIEPFVDHEATRTYTQIAWAETDRVGCGFAKFQFLSPSPYYHRLYVCHYGPRGNVPGAAMYDRGAACSRCPPGVPCVDGLCA